MSEKNRVEMPATGGGLFRPSDAEGQGIKFRPEQIIVFVAAIVVIEILLRLFI
ncbi:TPA: preprotein translocase subunit Sec61beta [archaeon]|nr:preprotein translocase subunit Sec61beta [Candidatus Naiadarchaeales archaeon SRR2090153.bin461]HIK02769.1 preprotein translocase subunit Sec61beta [Candidatus Naiadarchaeales archaeon SRR2090159.bin1288]